MNFSGIYKNKKILVTGHTGFKGAWLSLWLHQLGAKVIGYSLPQWDNNYLFKETNLAKDIVDQRGDVADFKSLKNVILKYKPQMVFHLAAQPLVRDSYANPKTTFESNALGTVNVLECLREFPFLNKGVIITTDKCYKNKETNKGYKETDELGGHDPYSTSKAVAELIIESYRKSFFAEKGILVASARAGNIIGGGDFSKDRLLPDCIRALKKNQPIKIRNPKSTRPWQFVLEPLYGYLLLGEKLLNNEKQFAQAFNFGPERQSIVPVGKIADLVIKYWGQGRWQDIHTSKDLHETKLLSLNISKAKKELNWHPRLNIKESVEMTVNWYKQENKQNARALCLNQIQEYTHER
ncbi:MAG: CDP-glucose 4,6-dehydratase [Candidatus Omnitrophica bacterium]|nr:CDP-glucose 4,6-dehydratase [Candidatus Omnitrophota bacterium]